jgi:hypothetical protein
MKVFSMDTALRTADGTVSLIRASERQYLRHDAISGLKQWQLPLQDVLGLSRPDTNGENAALNQNTRRKTEELPGVEISRPSDTREMHAKRDETDSRC